MIARGQTLGPPTAWILGDARTQSGLIRRDKPRCSYEVDRRISLD
jgi:hypothetical protein